jgi:hypothetical protein
VLPTPQIINNEVGSGEKLLWWGQPESMRQVFASFSIWLFAIPWTAFACFWVVMACQGVTNSKHSTGLIAWAFPLFGLPFILIGLAMLSAPLFAWLKLRSTYYLLTDKRLVVLTDGRTRTAQSYQLDGLSNLVRTEYGERGDLVWTVLSQPVQTPHSSLAKTGLPQPAVTSRSSLAHTVMSATTVSLLGIKEPRKVEKLVVDCCQKLLEKKHEY